MVILVLAGLAVAADYGARTAAQAVLADRIQQSAALPNPPDVQITGFPFLTQVLAGRYRAVDVRLADLPTTEGLRVDQVQARISGVHLPLSALFDGGGANIPVDRATATGVVSFATLDGAAAQALPSGTMTVRFGDGGHGRLGVDATYHGAGPAVTITATAKLALAGGRIRLSVLPDTLSEVPQQLRSQVAGLLEMTLDVQRLPLGLTPTAVAVGPAGVTLTVQATTLTLPAGG